METTSVIRPGEWIPGEGPPGEGHPERPLRPERPPRAARLAVRERVSPQGQHVVVMARWILVIAGFALSLWNPAALGELRVQIGALLLLAVANFYLHAQLLRHKPVVDAVAYGASAADLAVITAIILAQGGYESNLYVFYCVALLAVAVAFPLSQVIVFTGVTTALYAGVALVTLPPRAENLDLLTVIGRVLMIVAVATCGHLYQQLEERRARDRAPSAGARPGERTALEAKQDVFFGQVVLIWARWSVIFAGAVMALWVSDSPLALTLNILPVVVLMGVNFYLHARYLIERPANRTLIQLLSAVDLSMVTAIVLGWDSQRGLASPFFVYYYPLLVAFAFVFPPRLTAWFAAAVLAAYAVVCLALDPSMAWRAGDLKLLTVRLVTLGAMGGLGTYYWRLQRRNEGRAESAADREVFSTQPQPRIAAAQSA